MFKNQDRYIVTASGSRNRFVKSSMEGLMNSGTGSNVSANAMSNQYLENVLSGFVPEQDPRLMRKIYADIYYNDSISGSVVDLMSNIPFSDFSLTGLSDKKKLAVYMKNVDNLNLKSFFPSLSRDFLTNGAFLASLNYNKVKNMFDGIVPHSLDFATFKEVPVYGMDPLINISLPPNIKQILEDSKNDKRLKSVIDTIPTKFTEKIKKGNQIELDPATTVFLKRQGLFNTDIQGISYFRRLIPIWIMEKALIRGTIEQTQRRQRAIMHLMIGDEEWEPTSNELTAVADLFQSADMDPTNAIIATRNGINVTEVRRGDDFWKYNDIYDFTLQAKLRALGVSESFLSGDASFSTMDAAMSVFLEQQRSYREMVTRELFYEKIFPIIAVTNNYKKRGRDKFVGSHIRSGVFDDRKNMAIAHCHGDYKVPKAMVALGSDLINVDDIEDINEYEIPNVNWHKQLKPEGDTTYLDLLQTLQDKGVPIPIRMIAAAGGQSLDSIVEQFEDDVEIRQKLSTHMKQIKKYMPDSEMSNVAKTLASMPGNSTVVPKGLFNRKFDDSMEVFQRDSQGNRRVMTGKYRRQLNEKINRRIAHSAAKLAEEDNRREKAKK
jgi:hypothetical protein